MPRGRGYPRRRLSAYKRLHKKHEEVVRAGGYGRQQGIVGAIYDAAFDPHHPVANAVRKIVNAKPSVKAAKKFYGSKGTGKKAAQPKYRRRSVDAKRGMDRHEKLNWQGSVGPVNKGKGFNNRKDGVVTTHGKGVVPRWKHKRLGLYKYPVFQTILLSKSNRLAGSNNLLETFRYPVRAPECLDGERVQTMLFQPFCSHYSGIHSTMFRKIRSSDGADLDHDTVQTLDVVQNKCDKARHMLVSSDIDGAKAPKIYHQGNFAVGGAISAATARGSDNISRIHAKYDQLVKQIKVDLVFSASRAFPMRVSVSVVRMIDATAPYTLTSDDKMQMLNNLNNKGLEWAHYKTEWLHEFTLPGLKKGKDPPKYSVNKLLRTNFIQSNCFEKNNVAEAMTQAGNTQLGKGVDVRRNEVTDGDMSGAFVVMIKYRRIQQPQVFTYRQTIESDPVGEPIAQVELPAISEASFDIPNHPGSYTGGGGAPFTNTQGNESLGSFYVHGKIMTEWGFRTQTESIPALVSDVTSDTTYRKAQSLNIDPTFTTSDTHGIYTQSQNHVQLSADTSVSGGTGGP